MRPYALWQPAVCEHVLCKQPNGYVKLQINLFYFILFDEG